MRGQLSEIISYFSRSIAAGAESIIDANSGAQRRPIVQRSNSICHHCCQLPGDMVLVHSCNNRDFFPGYLFPSFSFHERKQQSGHGNPSSRMWFNRYIANVPPGAANGQTRHSGGGGSFISLKIGTSCKDDRQYIFLGWPCWLSSVPWSQDRFSWTSASQWSRRALPLKCSGARIVPVKPVRAGASVLQAPSAYSGEP